MIRSAGFVLPLLFASAISAQISVDVNTSMDLPDPAPTVSTPSFSTAVPNELLLAFIATDAPSGNNTTVQDVSGAGLVWELAVRTNQQSGTAEIWRAFAPSSLSNVTATATLSASVAASMTVMSFAGVDTSGRNGSGAIGAVGSGNASSGAPTATLVSARNASWVLGVGNDYDNAIHRTPAPGQSLVHEAFSPTNDTYWVQMQTAPVPLAGTAVIINDSAPASDRYNLSIVEILPAATAAPAWSLTGTINPQSSGAGTAVTLTGTVGALATADGSGNYKFTGLSNGSYTVSPAKSGYSFAPSSQSVTIQDADANGIDFSASALPVPVQPGPISIDVNTSADLDPPGTAVTIPAFSTASANELLLAFIATDAPSGNNTTVQGVSGAGLVWELAVRTNQQSGTAEIWRAFAPSSLSNVTATATLSASVAASMTVMSFAGVDTSGRNGSGAIGAVGSGNASSGAPTATLVTTRDASWVFGVGNDYDNTIGRTSSAGQSLVHQNFTSTGDTYWVQMLNAPTPAAGTAVALSDTAPTADRWNLSAVEILSGSAARTPSYTISGTITPQSSGAGTSILLTGPASQSVTADNSGNYKFTVTVNGSYTITPGKAGFSFSPGSVTANVNGSSISGVNFIATATLAPNLTVDVGQSFQRIGGMGVNINVNSWNGGGLKPALDYLVDTNGSSLFRVIRDPMTWVDAESLISPLHNLDPTTLKQVYEAPAMQDIWNTIAYLNGKGIGGNQIILNFMGWTPTWLGGSGAYGVPSYITAGRETEFATAVASLVYYGRNVKKLSFDLLSPVNELDLNCLEGPCVSTAQYGTLMHALAAELNYMGLPDVRFVLPETASDPGNYIAAISQDSTVFDKTDHLTKHVYGSSVQPGSSYALKDYWVTETAASCSSCDYAGTPDQGEWAFASQTNDNALDDLSQGIAAVAIYDGYDSFYYHHNSYGYWGLLAYDQSLSTYSPRKRLYVNAQLNRFIRPGMRRVSAATSLGGLSHMDAFFDSVTEKVAIVGHNSSNSPVTINGQFLNLPVALGALELYLTNSTTNLQAAPAVSVAGSSFAVTIPPDTFFSLRN